MKGERGFSYIEVLITIIFFALVLGPLAVMVERLMVSGQMTRQSYIAATLARGLLEEVQYSMFEDETLNPFGNEETTSSCSRVGFDDVDDYNIYQTWGGCNPPRDRLGNPISGADDFTADIQIINLVDIEAAPNNIRTDWSAQAQGTTDTKQAIVTVTWPGGTYTLTMIMERP
ncbi:hypothetical protein ACFLRA_01775 [Bdellovibrionota bacterium]